VSQAGLPDPSDYTTLTEVLSAYASGGFEGSFGANEGGVLECYTCDARFDAATVQMSSLRRLEGASDPADMMAVVALSCPRCSMRGTAVLGFGPTASAADSDVFGALRDHRGDDLAPGNSAPGETAAD